MDGPSWRELITSEMADQGEMWADVVACTLNDTELDHPFYIGYGSREGKPFTVWTVKRVYFPVVYDWAKWCGSVSRNPDGKATDPIGS